MSERPDYLVIVVADSGEELGASVFSSHWTEHDAINAAAQLNLHFDRCKRHRRAVMIETPETEGIVHPAPAPRQIEEAHRADTALPRTEAVA